MEINTLMDVDLVIDENMSKKSIFSLCLKYLATRRDLYFLIVPSSFSFFFKIHLQTISFHLRGKSKVTLENLYHHI